jgi:TolB protein
MWGRRRFTAALGSSLAAPVLAQFRVEISGIGETQLPIAVGAFRGEAASLVSPSSIIGADLQRSGVFRLVEPIPGLDELSPLPQDAARTRQADALLAGSVSKLADGGWDLRYRLWDVVKGEPYFGRSASVPAAGLRLAAHRIADEIYERLTGERGVFATRIAYVSRVGRNHALHVTDADGEGGQVALRSTESIISPAWSPDGKEIAYVSFETQKAAVWVQEVASGRRSMLANFRGTNSAPAWSPDGRELAVSLSRDGPSQIFLMTRAGGDPRRLTSGNSIDTEPVFAPDGKSLYFVSDRGGGPQVYRMPVTGGPPERLTFTGSYNVSPAISPDGKTMAYVSRQGGLFRVILLNLGNGNTRTLSESPYDDSPSFAPNGRLLVYASRDQGRDVLMTTTLDGRIKTRLLASGTDMLEPAWGPFGR